MPLRAQGRGSRNAELLPPLAVQLDGLAGSTDALDGHGFFQALGDSVLTGPTRTNVNDFRATLIEPR